jgi:hypothetical protein
VRHDRNAAGHDAPHVLRELAPALELDRLAAAFFEQLAGGTDRLLGRRVVAHERQVAHHVRPRRGAGHGAAVVTHLVERDRQRVRLPLHDHPERVADQQHVGPARFEQLGHRRVVRGDHRNLGPSFAGSQRGHRDFGGRHGSRET